MKTRHGNIGADVTRAREGWRRFAAGIGLCLAVACGAVSTARAEAILQVFNQSHNEIAARLPEIAEAGYTALWVPPPTKANGGMSVGYDLNDPFDIGNSDLRGTWSTRYGVEADLHNLIEMCHRFGMRVYFDNVMNHRSYDVPGYNESTPIDVYPGMCAEDFHLRTTSDGFYRKWDNVRSWDDEWQVMFLGLSDLLDIAHENYYDGDGNGPYNANFGPTEGSWHIKPYLVRHAYHKEDTWRLFDRMPYPGKTNDDYRPGDGALQNQDDNNGVNLYTGFENSAWNPEDPAKAELIAANTNWFAIHDASNGVSMTLIEHFPNFYKEQVDDYLYRAVRWLVDRTKVDGLRLDAVKHVPYDFFGASWGDDKDRSNYGYMGQAQWQFNMTRGFNDWENHRDSIFNIDAPRNDLMAFGEHLGAPPAQGPYVSTGMRLVDDRLRNELNWRFSANELQDFDNEFAGSELGPDCGVMHAQSHDNDFVDRKPLHHAMYFMRRGLGLVYSDGNNHAATLSGSGGAFPRWAQTDFLGQWRQHQIPTLLHAHENFARYGQYGRWSQGNFVAWQRGGEGSWATMLFQLNSGWDFWQDSTTGGDFGSDDFYLYDYASDMYMPHRHDEGWSEAPYVYGSELATGYVEIPPNSYAIWSWKNPDPSGLYPSPYPDCFVNPDDRIIAPDSRVITIMEDGKVVDPVMVVRKDGVDGDPDFNPYEVADSDATDYSYSIAIPRVTKGTNVTLAVKADGSAETLLLRLDGGMDFGNGISSDKNGDWRDAPPGMVEDFYLGFENTAQWFTRRIWSEKFASVDTAYCKVGTGGATTYEIGGSGTVTLWTNSTPYDGPQVEAPVFVYHDPSAETEPVPAETGTPVKMTNTYSALASVNGQDSAAGFGEWVNSSTKGGGDGDAGWFVHDTVEKTGLTGFTGGKAYGLWAKYTDDAGGGWPNAQVTRSFSNGGKGLLRASVDVGMKFDSNIEGRFKGVEFTDASGSAVFGVQMQNSQAVTYYGAGGGGTWSEEYGQAAFHVELERTGTGYTVRGTTRDGGTFGPLDVETDSEITGFKAYMNGVVFDKDTDDRQLYFDNLTYTAVVTSGRPVPQFSREGTGATVWAKTSHEQGARTFLYYTVDGDHWPEGGGGVPANPYTKAVEGSWMADSDSGSWWCFDLAGVPSGAALRYKISAFREMGYGGNGWGTIWPGNADAIRNKKVMMSLWTIPGLDFTTQSYHKHNDYTSWTTGFKDGYHLVTARMFLNRDDGAPIANTFRQTFYLDTHVPEGRILYPANDHEEVGGSSYGLVVQTDQTVDRVYYHITDSSQSNDGPGNGISTNGAVEWAEATLVGAWSKEMATNTAMPKIWKFNYNGIAPESAQEAIIRVRLCEVSSSPTNEWSRTDPALDDPDALHVRQLERKVWTKGLAYYLYFDWPAVSNEMVEANWEFRLKYNWQFAEGLDDDGAKALFNIQFESPGEEDGQKTVITNRVPGSDGSVSHQWNHPHDNQLSVRMPNLFTGDENDIHRVVVTGTRKLNGNMVTLAATNTFRTKGPLLPACIITTPPETDSDGVKWVITMEDSTNAATSRALRETPIVVLTDAEATRLDLSFVSPTDYSASISATPTAWATNETLRLTNVVSNGTTMTWTFAWQVTNAGSYRFQAGVTADNSSGKYTSDSGTATNTAFRTANVRFLQLVHVADTNDVDWDDDGIRNVRESDSIELPKSTDETWTQGEVFDFHSTGKSDSASPDTDGDGLPDGLELGYRLPAEGTDPATDTNGDGWPNFIGDLDPPFYNTLPDNYSRFDAGVISDAGTGADRTRQVVGSVTDPRNPDSDSDGIPDGVEDANRNGWTDGDGNPFPTNYDPYKGFVWADGKMAGETWEETAACVWDSDADGLCDGYGEDLDLDGMTDLALLYEDGTRVELVPADYPALGIGIDNASSANSSSTLKPKPYTSRAINYDALFAAYNVTDPDGNGTKQTNGWPRLVIAETDPLCKDTDHDGLPDGWEANYSLDPLNNGVYDFRTGQFTDDPTHGPKGNPDGDKYIQGGQSVDYDNAAELLGGTNPRSPDNGASGGGASGSITVGTGDAIGSVNGNAFYTEATQWTLADLVALDDYNQGGNSADIYRFGDGFDSSRDMVAFYFRDGGSSSAELPGDDRLYFRVDFDDLQAFAEDNALNIYVAINFGSYGNGITWLPDDVNCESVMRWNAVSGVYDTQNGCLYVQNGEESYESKPGYGGAWFNSELDTVVWSIDRKVLVDAGWNGMGDKLLFQVYTTRDFTNDDGGSGDKGGLNDFADTIGDDWLCSDYYQDWNYIHQNGKYSTCVTINGSSGWNNRGQHAKLAMVAHGNQAVEPGNVIQGLVNNGFGAGYDRPIQIHNIYTNCPLNLHVTPTLAIALQWAEVGTENAWYSGPALNAAIRKGVANGALALLGSTFSDHIPGYFPDDFNKENVDLAAAVLDDIYGGGSNVVSRKVLWSPERVVDADWLVRMGRLGYQATLVDQTPHLLEWFGRQTALGNDAYKIQRYWIETSSGQWTSADAFALSTAASQFRYVNTDGGLASDLRRLFLRRARTGEAAISSIFYTWEDFSETENADAYDRSLRWIANHPWIQVVTLDAALDDEKLSGNVANHNLAATNGMASQDWVHHACNGNYDNWFYGSWRHESLSGKKFEVRQGKTIAEPWGTRTNGVLQQAWNAVRGIRNAQVKALAEATIFASAFETAFHIEDNNNLARWSYGEYMDPATGWHWNDAAQDWEPMGLMAMSWKAQSRTRLAAVYAAVDEWTRSSSGSEALSADLDLDGEPEWILRNGSVMAVFEAEGGLMVGAWYKNGTNVWQMVGNFAAQPETGYETQSPGSDSTRGTAMKDIKVGDTDQVAAKYTVTSGADSLTFKSGSVTKTVSLSTNAAAAFDVAYSAAGKKLSVRNGLSPDLATLMLGGQSRLSEQAEGNSLVLTTTSTDSAISATVTVTDGTIDASATDQPKDSGWNTVNLRNAPQVRQVDVTGTGSVKYTIEFAKGQTSQEPPTLTVSPPGEQIFPVGSQSSFRVSATDWQGNALPVEATAMPIGSSLSGNPVWDAGTGVFSWKMGAFSDGSRTNDWKTNAVFSATDFYRSTASADVNITIPWDADGNGMGDDWEYIARRKTSNAFDGKGDSDADGDGFVNSAEWAAGTDPADPGDYIGWDEQIFTDTDVTYRFHSVPGRRYEVQSADMDGLLVGTWITNALVTADSSNTFWSVPLSSPQRTYRLRIIPR